MFVSKGVSREDQRNRVESSGGGQERARENDFQARVHADSYFEPIKGDLDKILNDATTLFGRAPQQVEEFIVDYVEPVLAEYAAEDAIEIVDLEL